MRKKNKKKRNMPEDERAKNGEFVERVHRPRLAPETCTATPIPVALPHITWLPRRPSIARFRTSVRRLPTRPPVEHIRPRWKATQRWRGSMVLRVCHCRRDPVIDHLCPSPMSCICCIFFCLLGLRSPNVYTLTIGCVLHSAQACSRRPLSSRTEQSIRRVDGAGGGGGEKGWSPQASNA